MNWIEHRNAIREYLYDTIIDDDTFIIDFLGDRENLELQVDSMLDDLSDEDLKEAWNDYCDPYTIEDFLTDYLEEELE